MAQAGFTNYINRKSFLHQMNPTLKFAMCVMLIVLVFIPNGIFGELILLINVMILWFGSKLPKRLFWAIIKSGFFMLAVLFVMNWVAFKTPGLVLIDKNNIIFNVDSFKSFNLGEHTYCYNIGSLAGGNI
jgi:energy-coupling factor transporter transmembrane protein EcfT